MFLEWPTQMFIEKLKILFKKYVWNPHRHEMVMDEEMANCIVYRCTNPYCIKTEVKFKPMRIVTGSRKKHKY